jgi:hypothetical protein
MSDIGFTINKVGNFPTEKYDIAPIQTIFSPLVPYGFDYFSFYCNQPYTWLTNLNSSTYQIFNGVTRDSNYRLTYTTNGKITYDSFAARKSLDSGYVVNYFYLESHEEINTERVSYAYLLYPEQLVLAPTSVSKINNNSFNIGLKASLLNYKNIFFKSVTPSERDSAPLLHTNYIKSDGKSISDYPTSSNNYCSFLCSISSTKSVVRTSIVEYSSNNQPISYTKIIENNQFFKKIKKDKTFFDLGMEFTIPDTGQTFTYYIDHPDSISNPRPFSAPFNFTNNTKNIQTFAFLQSGVNPNIAIGDSSNCVLSAVLDLQTTRLDYYSRDGIRGYKPVKMSYLVDSSNMMNGEAVQDTILSFKVNNTTITNLATAIPSTTDGNNNITYNTKYPPHFYSYNISLISPPNITEPIEEYSLTFKLTSIPYRETTNSVLISTYLKDDFGKINLDLETYGYYDQIKYEPDFLVDTFLLDDISATVGTNTTRVSYDLKNPTWIPASSNPVLEITFPTNREEYTNLSIRPMLSNWYSGLNAAQNVMIIPIKGNYVSPPYNLSIKRIKEGDDYIDLSIEHLNNTTTFPFIDLTNSSIQWKINPQTSYTKLNYLIKNSSGDYVPIDYVNPNDTLNYGQTSWAIRLSGHGPIETQITLSSQKYNATTNISTDPQFFDFFSEQKVLLIPSTNLNNQNEIRTITLSAVVPYKGRLYNLPESNSLYWNWEYNNTYTENTPITAKRFKNLTTDYDIFSTESVKTTDALNFFIKPPKSNSPSDNTIKINVYTADTIYPYTGSYTLQLDSFPDTHIFNADFFITYTNFSDVKLLETRNKFFTLTRRRDANAEYTIYVNPDIVSTLTNSILTWTITDASGNITTGTGNGINLTANSSWRYYVNLKISNAIVADWELPHTVEQNATIYSLDTSVFDRQLKFIVYPEYTWNNSDQLTFLDKTNYTLAKSPTAYNYKKSNTENFWVSSDGIFDRFVYTEGSSKTLLSDTENYSINDEIKKITINYNNELTSNVGTTIYLSAYNEYYPSNTPLYYFSKENNQLVTRNYNITAQTIPHNSNTPSNLLFFQNPKLVDYNAITHTFSATITSFDLDFNRSIIIRQKFNTNPLNTPAKIETTESTVTYMLSTPKWVVKTDVPAVDGTYKLFTIRPGDDLSPLRVKNTSLNTLYLNASSNLNIKIPKSTFDTVNAGNQGLLLGGDLWNSKNIKISERSNWETLKAYTTSTQPEIFLNTNYVLKQDQIFVEFDTPNYEKNPITSYAVNFGEGNIQIKSKNDVFYYAYDNIGTFYLSYSAIYADSTKKTFIEKTPFIVKENWDKYDIDSIRFISEKNLELPYNLNDVSIQPNEFGDVDIFNTCLTRINDNLNYLKNNIQTLNSNAPSYYYGWMGSNRDNRSGGIRWYTTSYGSEFYELPYYSISEGSSYFTKIKDIYIGNFIYVLDGTKFRLFKYNKNCEEIIFENSSEMDELFFDPKSMTLNGDETSIYVVDSIKNKIYKFDFDFSDPLEPIFTYVLSVGALGSLNDKSKFDFPSELNMWNDNLFVLDYNNNCIKQYSDSLSWIHTYYDEDVLKNDQLLNFDLHPNGLIYAISKNLKVYIFDQLSNSIFSSFDVSEIGESEIVKISFDENGDFLYVITEGNVFKYSVFGELVTIFNLPNISGLKFTSCKHGLNKQLYISTENSILRFQDFVELFKIGDGLNSEYWSMNQILLKKEEFATDINYNLALNRTAQNLKTFKTSLNAKFVLVSEQTARGTATYFSLMPVGKDSNDNLLNSDVENENLKIGINEFYVPDVVNRELKKLHESQVKLRQQLDVSYNSSSSLDNGGNNLSNCGGDFCWSWKAMSCYDLTLPIIRLCNINPITYGELMNTFPVNYAPTKQWKNATSNCCNEYASPLI